MTSLKYDPSVQWFPTNAPGTTIASQQHFIYQQLNILKVKRIGTKLCKIIGNGDLKIKLVQYSNGQNEVGN